MRKASRFRFAIAITILLLAAALWFLLAHEFTFSVGKEPPRERDGSAALVKKDATFGEISRYLLCEAPQSIRPKGVLG
jgi:hypothetical protein